MIKLFPNHEIIQNIQYNSIQLRVFSSFNNAQNKREVFDWFSKFDYEKAPFIIEVSSE